MSLPDPARPTPESFLTLRDANAAPAAPAAPPSADDQERRSVPDLLSDLANGNLTPEAMPKPQRLRCVEYLSEHGYSADESAHLLRVSPRTIKRDRAEARKNQALEPGIDLGDQLMGEHHRLATASIERLTRLALDAETPAYARLWAEESILRIHQRLLDNARKLHYFPTGNNRLRHLVKMDPDQAQRDQEFLRAITQRGAF